MEPKSRSVLAHEGNDGRHIRILFLQKLKLRRSLETCIMRSFNLEQLSKHSTESSAYIAINGHVYDVTDFLEAHPGGKRVILPVLGTDASAVFKLYHSEWLLPKYQSLIIGTFEGYNADADSTDGAEQSFGNLVAFAEPGWCHGQPSAFYKESHCRLRKWARSLVEMYIMPYVQDWEAAGVVPRTLYEKFGKEGFLSCVVGMTPWQDFLPHDPPCGIARTEWNIFHEIVVADELARCGSVGTGATLTLGPSIALPCIINYGSRSMENIIKEVLLGEKTICLAITEPYAGSDVANIQTSAVLSPDGKRFVVNGEKKWITNGAWADYFVVAVRTGKEGMNGISLLLLTREMAGLSTRPMCCQGNVGSGTAFVIFENVEVPFENLIGELHKGFKCIMSCSLL
ncbi:hypothetical protein HDU83_004321 [Entophlyctis luteolus]|nr:hypothetical protein HDU83_004321 [Entophlyctis luteolus]